MGASLSGTTLEIRSWFRRYLVDVTQISSVGLALYNARGEVRSFPFFGQVRILSLEIKNGKTRDFPATLGRRRRVQQIARDIVSYVTSLDFGAQLADSYYE